MSDSTLSFASSSNFRDILLARNLQPYSVPGSYSPSSNSVKMTAVFILQSNDDFIE